MRSPSLGFSLCGDFEISHGVVGSKTGGIQHFWLPCPKPAPSLPQVFAKLYSCTVDCIKVYIQYFLHVHGTTVQVYLERSRNSLQPCLLPSVDVAVRRCSCDESVPQVELIEGPPPPPRMVVVAEAVIVAPVRPHPDATCPAGLPLIIGNEQSRSLRRRMCINCGCD